MQNGYFHDEGKFAPETAVGTGAQEPLVDEYAAAEQVPTVDENTLGTGRRSLNRPRVNEDEIDYSGEKVADDASTEVSNGEDFETREVVADPHADDAEVNQLAEDTRPEAPQDVKPSRKKKDTV